MPHVQVITRARELWKEEAGKRELLDRVAFKEGDFFDHGESSLIGWKVHQQEALAAFCCTPLLSKAQPMLASCNACLHASWGRDGGHGQVSMASCLV